MIKAAAQKRFQAKWKPVRRPETRQFRDLEPKSDSVRIGFALVCAATVALCATPVFSDELADGVGTIPGSVEDVRIGGTWQRDGKSGVYRIVVARNGGNAVTARLFVQWIAYGDTGGSALEHSMEISEFDDLDLDIVDYLSESDAEGLSVYIEAIDPESGIDEQYELFVFGPDDYRVGTASN